MKSTLAIPRTAALVVRKPPLFAVFCVLLWGVSLWLALHHQIPVDTIDAASAVVAP